MTISKQNCAVNYSEAVHDVPWMYHDDGSPAFNHDRRALVRGLLKGCPANGSVDCSIGGDESRSRKPVAVDYLQSDITAWYPQGLFQTTAEGDWVFFAVLRGDGHESLPALEAVISPTAELTLQDGEKCLLWALAAPIGADEGTALWGRLGGASLNLAVPLPGAPYDPDDPQQGEVQLTAFDPTRRYTLAELEDGLSEARSAATPLLPPGREFGGKYKLTKFQGRPFFGRLEDGVVTPLVAPFAVVGAARYPDRDNLRDLAVAFENEMGEREIVRIPADAIPAREKVVGLLRGRGLVFAHAKDGAALVHHVLMATQPPPQTLYDRPGWIPGGRGFLLPSGVVVGADPAKVGLSDRVRISAPAKAGTFEAWRAGADAAWKSESLSLKASLAAGFAGPLLALAGRGTLVLALTGTTSQGKTWRQQVGVAVSGPPMPGVGQMRSLNSTENALEAPLARGSATITAFDETHFTEPATVQRLVFLAAGGLGKARLARDGGETASRSWSGGVLTISTEVGLAQLLRQEGERQTGGVTVRMIEIDVEGDGRLSERDFKAANAMLANHGHALPRFLKHLIEEGYADDPGRLTQRAETLISRLPGVDAAPAHRAALGVGFLGVAAEIAKKAGLAPEGLDVPAMVGDLWDGAQASGVAAEDPVSKAIERLVETINAKRGTEVYDHMSQEERTYPRDPSREIGAWIDTLDGERVYVIRESIIAKWSGGAVDTKKLIKELRARGDAIPDGKGGAEKATVWTRWRQPVGKTRVVVLWARAVEGEDSTTSTTSS